MYFFTSNLLLGCVVKLSPRWPTFVCRLGAGEQLLIVWSSLLRFVWGAVPMVLRLDAGWPALMDDPRLIPAPRHRSDTFNKRSRWRRSFGSLFFWLLSSGFQRAAWSHSRLWRLSSRAQRPLSTSWGLGSGARRSSWGCCRCPTARGWGWSEGPLRFS